MSHRHRSKREEPLILGITRHYIINKRLHLIVFLFDEQIGERLVNSLVVGALDCAQVWFHQGQVVDL